MLNSGKKQNAFAAGEISPGFYGRTDLVKYDMGLKTALNYFVGYRGGMLSRPGTEYVGQCDTSTPDAYAPRLFRFRASGNDYLLVLNENKLQIMQNGAFIVSKYRICNGVSMAVYGGTPSTQEVQVSFTASSVYDVGAIMVCTDPGGYPEFANKLFRINYSDGSIVRMVQVFWGSGLAEDFTIISSGTDFPTFKQALEVATPWSREELTDLKFEQQYAAGIFTTVSETPRRLTFVSPTNWAFTTVSFGSAYAPTGVTLTPSSTGTAGAAFVVTSVRDGIESVGSTYAISQLTKNYSLHAGDEMKVTWTPVSGAEYYNVYRSLIIKTGTDVTSDLEVGYIGRSVGETFVDTNIAADFTKSPPINYNPFTSNNPAVFRLFQQRGVYAGSTDQPMTIWGSKPGATNNFDVSNVLNDGDAYTFTLDRPEIDPIQDMVALRKGLLVFTKTSINLLNGGQSSAITPNTGNVEIQAYKGINQAGPVSIDQDILFSQEDSSSLNAMMFTEFQDTFQMNDISILSSHLFGTQNQVTRFAWQAEPHKLLWILQENGTLLSCTYERAQEVFGFAKHETNGIVRDIVYLRENNRDVIYMLVERYTNNKWHMFIERLFDREDNLAEDVKYLDAALTTTLNEETSFLYPAAGTGTGITVTSSDTVFTSDDWIGRYLYFNGAKAEIKTRVSTWQVTVDYVRDMDDLSLTRVFGWQWGIAVTTLSGLGHLEGETVSGLVDGVQVSSLTVSNGQVTLPSAGVKVILGLSYECRLETLPIQPQETQLADNFRKAVKKVGVRYENSKGMQIGATFDEMYDVRPDTVWTDPNELHSDLVVQDINGYPHEEITICLKQALPYPSKILSLTSALSVSMT